MQRLVISFPPKATRCRSIIQSCYMIYMMYIIYCIKVCNRNFMRLPKWNTFHPFSQVSNSAHFSIFSMIFFRETFGVPPDDTSIPNHDSLGSGWCQERQTHCPERSLLSPVSPEPHESLCYGSRWTDGRVCDGGVCGVDLSFKRRVDASPVFCEGPSETGLLRNRGLKPKFMLKRSSPLQNFQLFLKIRGTTAVHCNPWGFWRRSFGGIFERPFPKFVVPGQVIFAYWGKCVGRWSSCFLLSGFQRIRNANLMSHGRRFKEMNQLCSHELYIYNLWVEYHENNPPSLKEHWCMFFGPLFSSAGFPSLLHT